MDPSGASMFKEQVEESNHGNIKGKNSPKVKRGKEVGEDDIIDAKRVEIFRRKLIIKSIRNIQLDKNRKVFPGFYNREIIDDLCQGTFS